MAETTPTPDQQPEDPEVKRERELIGKLRARMLKFFEQKGARVYQQWKEDCIGRIKFAVAMGKMPLPSYYKKARLYYLLVGGSIFAYRDETYDFFDYPGEYSIQKMIEALPVEDEEEH